MFRSQASGAFFDIADMAEGFHAACRAIVSFPFQALPLFRLSASFV
jgi:hypothetical protein